ncbi:site-specific DNA-methyltransferase [Bifidobacterium choloepi]|uniref:Site-specific DNA-methyltransferase n=1 Tax=Bifidobacterium choloepi TaxID=2614131 RepID=A0A6I5NLC0_9BIFI|nr:site-specific DNA-methyltransferase [Bifidobacterium choloepi]NEG69592.1 site-specific DNA-methyltransferase [Bifidobacterium choloepi]
MTEEPTRLSLESADIVRENIEKLGQLFPEIIEDGHIDFDKLREILGDEVDDGPERYAFTWPGKHDAIRQSQTPSTATLRPQKDKSVNWDTTKNLYIEGDNLEVLKLLQRSYHGKVKMIYIDPPYNTGHDFVYNDKFGDPIENYKRQTGQESKAHPETDGRFHSAWCSMMYPRLRLARELLSDDGVIFISIDDGEQTNLRKLLDDIFGPSNFIACFIWRKVDSPNDNHVSVTSDHEYVLAYCKDARNVDLMQRDAPEIVNAYKGPDENGRFWRDRLLRKNGKNSLRSDRPTMFYPLTAPDGTEVWPIREDGKEGCWAAGLESVRRLQEADELVWEQRNGKWIPYTREYAKDNPTKPWMTIWNDLPAMRQTKAEMKELFGTTNIFDTPKPTELIVRCAKLCGVAGNDVTLDFFSGSASSADAMMQLNTEDGGRRRFIMVQLPEACSDQSEAAKDGYGTICELGEERIRRAGQKIKNEIEEANRQPSLDGDVKTVPDIGFRVLTLDSSNLEAPESSDEILLIDDMVKEGRSNEDLLFEVMLKWGLDLSLPIETLDIDGYTCWSVARGELICCMDKGLTVSVLEHIATLEDRPRRVLMLDSVLDDNLKLNAEAIFSRSSGDGEAIELRTV